MGEWKEIDEREKGSKRERKRKSRRVLNCKNP